jgi:hypothetical protein
MARENTQAEELYEVAVLLLSAWKAVCRQVPELNSGKIKALIRRAEKATKARPK